MPLRGRAAAEVGKSRGIGENGGWTGVPEVVRAAARAKTSWQNRALARRKPCRFNGSGEAYRGFSATSRVVPPHCHFLACG